MPKSQKKLIEEIRAVVYNELNGNPVYSSPLYALKRIGRILKTSGYDVGDV